MKYYSILLVIVCVLCSCDSEDELSEITMMDGNTITVDKYKRFYSTEEEFVHDVSFSFPREYNLNCVEKIDYLNNQEYTVYDYNQSFIGCWVIAEFGNWIKEYGLIPNVPYYVSTMIYVKYLSETPKGLRIVPKFGEEHMGYCPDIIPKTFRVYHYSNRKLNVLTTGFKYIGYDSKRKPIAINIPSFIDNSKNKLTWNFLIRDDGWD